MKRLFPFFFSVALVGMSLVCRGEPDTYVFPDFANAPTGIATAATSDSTPLRGYLDRIEIIQTQTSTNVSTFTETTGTVSLVVMTNLTTAGGLATFSLYSNAGVTTGLRHKPRYAAVNATGGTLGSTNDHERYLFMDEVVRASVSALNATNNNFRIRLILEK